MGYGAAQDRVIARSLRQYEALKPIASQLKQRGDSLHAANRGLHRVIVYQDSTQARTQRIVAIQGLLYKDADTKAQAWQRRAKARWWSSVGLGALALLLGAAAVR